MSQFDPTTKIWSGPQIDRSEDKLSTFRETVLKCLRSAPEKVFQYYADDETEMTLSEVEVMSIRVAKNLQKFGVKKHDVISAFFKNTSIVAPIAIGCFLLGAPVNPVICRVGINVEWIKATFAISRPKIVIMDDASESYEMMSQTLRSMGLDTKVFLVGQDQAMFSENLLKVDELFKETGDEKSFKLPTDDGVDDETVVFILPSTGTTGTPKSVSLSGESLKFLKYISSNKDDNANVTFAFSTLSWFAGVICLLRPLLSNGTRVISTEPFTPKTFGKIVKKYQVTNSILSSENAIVMFESSEFNPDDFASIKEVFCGGERVQISVREYLRSNLPPGCFGIVYGSTECGIIATYDENLDTSGIKDNVVGNLISNVRCQIVDLSSRTPLGPNKFGELLANTEMMFKSYYKNPELTASAFDGCWIKTGDVGYFDEHGYLHIYGRAVDMITVDGELIHPTEIESVFETYDGIRSSFATTITDANMLAVLCTRTAGSTISEADLKSKALTSFPNLTFNGGIYIVKEFPRTAINSRKVHRGDTRELALKLMNFRDENNSLLK